ncbi:MAG TPA: RDD family protein [Ktedonobacterales bacterium]
MLKMRSAVSRDTAGHLVPAGLKKRIGAFGIDYLPIAAYLAALTGVAAALRRTPLRDWLGRVYSNPYTAQLADSLAFDLPVMAYFALFEASPWEATPGKRRLGLRVVTIAGGRVSLPQAAARIALKFLPWEIAHTSLWHTPGWPRHSRPTAANYASYALVYALAGAYVITLLTSDTRQAFYDRLTHTRVVLAPHDKTHTKSGRAIESAG